MEDTIKQTLLATVEGLRHVGRERARLLERMGIRTASDLLFDFPRDYQDLSDERLIAELDEDELQSVRAEVTETAIANSGFGKTRVSILVQDSTGHLRATWFNQPFMRGKFHEGQQLLLTAKPKMRGMMWEMSHPQITFLADEEDPLAGRKLLPVYALTEGLSQFYMRRMVWSAVEELAEVPEEVFPEQLLRRYKIEPLSEAIRGIHQPADLEVLERARRRFIFQELFVLQLAVSTRRSMQRSLPAPPLPATTKIDARIRRLLPFELTESQSRAIGEVSADMALDRPMNRLLQGDVGSGKTLVALYAMLVAVAHGKQAVLMAPTEILARQHADTLAGMLEASRVRFAVLAGGTAKSEREQILADIAAGEINVVLGTHAVIQDAVKFKDLGLVVIDEQHKFGVRQRAALRQGDMSPHYLVMTATPIPRTVTMTLFGDLDISTLTELPGGRQPINTYLVEPDQQTRWWQFVRDRLREGRQAYVVAPLVDESETVSAPSVAEAFEQLTNGELEAFRIALLHGRLSPADKQETMDLFRDGETQVLVSTSVIEVGVDVPNASVMTIAGAERFGLAQLHQLRGRVGRGNHAGFCGVLVGEELSDQGRERLTAFSKSTDGFALAELDFSMRGPGDLFGTQQHGLPPLRIADLQRDRDILEEARREAQLLVSEDPGLKHADHERLRVQMLKRYGEALDISDVG
ncbi:ATP-dependent DNA helicase RecG [Bythopirellula polymerisocia]|uniref:ATP-dependent DNA helicase RecG n=1 Tax=Bythopirellula polymerisocia TaxID=2528003 RepID=A0A5C6CEE3_9BACT|nr:ATP-dependent DNA helicase RecG [Bythopirellula polymerisocia]TWU22638.1 ATP-dependent DNA helicase RecG [Bythopirellula polymerisocia]